MTGMGAVAGSALSLRQVSCPFMSGIITSSSTRSGHSSLASSKARGPSLANSRRYSWSSNRRINCRLALSSSTTSSNGRRSSLSDMRLVSFLHAFDQRVGGGKVEILQSLAQGLGFLGGQHGDDRLQRRIVERAAPHRLLQPVESRAQRRAVERSGFGLFFFG